MELFLAEVFMQFAPQQYWDRQQIPTPAGARMRPSVSPVTELTSVGGNPQPTPSTVHQIPSSDAQLMHMHLNRNSTVQNNQTAPHVHMHPMDTHQTRSEELQQPGTQPFSSTPLSSSIRIRFTACPTGEICPSAGCSFPHHNNIGRLTRHWRAMHGAEIMPGGTVDTEYYNGQSARICYIQCPHPGCTFQHQRSSNRLNAHLEQDHQDQPLLR